MTSRDQAGVVGGMTMKLGARPSERSVYRFAHNKNELVLGVNPDGTVTMTRDGEVIGQSAGAMTPGRWYNVAVHDDNRVSVVEKPDDVLLVYVEATREIDNPTWPPDPSTHPTTFIDRELGEIRTMTRNAQAVTPLLPYMAAMRGGEQ